MSEKNEKLWGFPKVDDDWFIWLGSRYPDIHPADMRLTWKIMYATTAGRVPYIASNYIRRLYNTQTCAKEILDRICKAIGATILDHDFDTHQARKVIVDLEQAKEFVAAVGKHRTKKEKQHFSPLLRTPVTREMEEKAVAFQVSENAHTYKSLVTDRPELAEYLSSLCKFHMPKINLPEIDNKKLLGELRAAFASLEYGPIYCPSDIGHGYRLFQRGLVLLQYMSTEDRQVAFPAEKGFVELDLSNAHFAFIAMLSRNKTLTAALKAGDPYVAIAERTGTTRKEVKAIMTPTLYGARKAKLLATLEWKRWKFANPTLEDENAPEIKALKKFAKAEWSLRQTEQLEVLRYVSESTKSIYDAITNDELYKEARKAAHELCLDIKDVGGINDAFGHRISLGDKYKPQQVLAWCCESYEKYLWYPVVLDHDLGYRVVLDQHDGITVWISNLERKAKVLTRIRGMVNKRARKQGVITQVVAKYGE